VVRAMNLRMPLLRAAFHEYESQYRNIQQVSSKPLGLTML
jgi:hypothetical protein